MYRIVEIIRKRKLHDMLIVTLFARKRLRIVHVAKSPELIEKK